VVAGRPNLTAKVARDAKGFKPDLSASAAALVSLAT
jgi:hypothetical protein